jgi:hypothetical protein
MTATSTLKASQGEKPYRISAHAHACRTREHIVILDLKHNKYLALDGTQGDKLVPFIEGWPRPPEALSHPSYSPNSVESLLHNLRSNSLITEMAEPGEHLRESVTARVTGSLVSEYVYPPRRLRATQATCFILSTTLAATRLRWRGLEHVVLALQARKRSHSSNRGAFRFEAAREVIEEFDRLQPLMFSAKEGCLLHSLALIELLARKDLFPTLVIGVRTRPFGAHAWIQEGGTVLNDLAERVRKFTAILAV